MCLKFQLTSTSRHALDVAAEYTRHELRLNLRRSYLHLGSYELRHHRQKPFSVEIGYECVRPGRELWIEAATDDGGVDVDAELLHNLSLL